MPKWAYADWEPNEFDRTRLVVLTRPIELCEEATHGFLSPVVRTYGTAGDQMVVGLARIMLRDATEVVAVPFNVEGKIYYAVLDDMELDSLYSVHLVGELFAQMDRRATIRPFRVARQE